MHMGESEATHPGRCHNLQTPHQLSLFLSLDHHCRGHTQQFSQSGSHHGCQPPCQVPHSECGADLKCHCTRGHHPTYLPAPILSSRPPTLVFCQILDSGAILGSNAAMANGTGPHPGDNPMVTDHNTTVPISYFPGSCYYLLFFRKLHCIALILNRALTTILGRRSVIKAT
jgi:hypothetical protein